MLKIHQHRSASAAVVLMLAGLLTWPAASVAQLGGLLPPPPTTTTTSPTVVGSASAVQATVLGILGTGTTTVLAGTGTLGGTNDIQDATMDTGSGISTLSNLAINGTPIAVTGDPNQTIWVPGGQVIINEQTISPTGTAVVNALHVAITGVADVVIASATAGIS